MRCQLMMIVRTCLVAFFAQISSSTGATMTVATYSVDFRKSPRPIAVRKIVRG
jgi:hypothetical protein